MKSVRQIVAGLLVGIGIAISMIFWVQELRYVLPAPPPGNDGIVPLQTKYGNETSLYNITIGKIYETLADRYGVYSTSQAIVLNHENKIYYRGNYNKERLSTVKNSNFVEIAINNLLAGDQKVKFSELATCSYGGQLLSNKKTGYGYAG
jgi:hypothetical protein